MHRCLTIVEVQHAIFREVQTEPFGNTTLTRLARTCRIFQNTALDILWEKLPSICFLFQCLPSDLWGKELITVSGHQEVVMKFQRTMSSADWEIFFRFSTRIRSLSFSLSRLVGQTSVTVILGVDVINALSQPPTHGPLIPNLKTLCWTESNINYTPLLQSLLTRSLVDLSLPLSALRSPEMPMDLIGTRCPSLKNFCIQHHGIPPISVEDQLIVSRTLIHMNSLESFEYPALDELVIISLSNLPSLVKVSGRLKSNLQLRRPREYSTPHTFLSLDSLTLNLGDNHLPIWTSLLEVVRFGPREVTFTSDFTVSPTPDLSMFNLFFFALANACASERLSYFSLTMLSYNEGSQVSLSTFDPLLAFPNVTSFTLDTGYDICLDDDAIDTLTTHWPKLTKLSFNPTRGWGIQSRVTHRGLITLLTRCTSLASFALAVDFSEVDIPPSSIPLSRLGNKITCYCRHADFVTSMIEYPPSIAAFLSDICPWLSKVTSHRDGDGWMEELGNETKWEQVNDFLPGFLAVRRQYTDTGEGMVDDGTSVHLAV